MKFLNKDYLSLACLVLIYLVFWTPVINVLPGISTGDMGRDLYAFQMTLQKKWPCRDYFWNYGPLMLLYYAFWLLVGGMNLVSVRMGLGVIYLFSSVCAYRTLRLFVSPVLAFLSSLAFLNFDMSWTFNHIGTIPFLLLSIFFLWKFFLTLQVKWNYFALFSLVVIALIKISAGVFSFLAFCISLLCFKGLIHWRYGQSSSLAWKHSLFIPLIFGGVVFGTYLFLYSRLSFDQINQCQTILPAYRAVGYSPWDNLKHLVLRFFVWERSRLLIIGILLVLAALASLSLKRRGLTIKEREIYPCLVVSLFLFGIFNSIEYLMQDDGLIYRFDFWIFPVTVLLMGLLAEGASRLLGRGLKVLLGVFVFLALLWFPSHSLKEALAFKVPERYLDFPQGQVYLGGPLSNVKVIKEVTRFIVENTEPTQEILAIPYDILYCFLSGRQHAVREFVFLVSGSITQDGQEREVIQKIQAKQPPFVLISNRYRSEEVGVGHFGKTHCRRLARYIFDHYREIRTFGPWQEGGRYHAIKVFQKK